MGQAVVKFLNTQSTIPRDSAYNLQFKIIHPTMDSNITQSYPMVDDGVLDIGNLYSTIINKNDWIYIDNVAYREDETSGEKFIDVSGLQIIPYRYKVEIEETGTVLKPFTSYFYDVDTVDTSVNITKDMFATWNPYHIKVTVEQNDGVIVESLWQVHVYDTEPILNVANVENNVLSFQIGDLEDDSIKYRIKLNGRQVYPPNTTNMTELQPSPVSGNILLPKDIIIPESSNTIVIEAEDSLGKFISFTPVTFIGTYQGLMFMDDLDNVYTTDLGIIRELIDFGLIQAGQESSVKTIYLKNLTGYDIRNLKITLDTSVSINGNIGNDTDVSSIPNNTAIWIAKDAGSFVDGNNEIIFDRVIMSGERVSFVLKVTTDIFSTGVGQFGLKATATPA